MIVVTIHSSSSRLRERAISTKIGTETMTMRLTGSSGEIIVVKDELSTITSTSVTCRSRKSV